MGPHSAEATASEPFLYKNNETISGDETSQTIQHAPCGNQVKKIAATRMHRSTYVLWLVFFYAALVLFSWIVICKLSYHPLTFDRYGTPWLPEREERTRLSRAEYAQMKFQQNERWYKAAQVVQSITGVLTIPLTSAVCSSAVVIYLQQCPGKRTPSFTLRQLIVLADKGWTNIPTFFSLLTGGWTHNFSLFLAWAVVLIILGAIISPIQQIFLSTETFKVPTDFQYIEGLFDIPQMVSYYTRDPLLSSVPIVRMSLASAAASDISPQLWTRTPSCNGFRDSTDSDAACTIEGSSWGNMSTLSDPFIAELIKDSNTGLMQQFLPRLNSTARFENISAESFPTNCDTIPGALSIRQGNSPGVSINNETYEWTVHACMPADLRTSPWKQTRARQDFEEELFLNISLSPALLLARHGYGPRERPVSEYFRVTTNTTGGYFELPNYANGQKPGPLLVNDPGKSCGENCAWQNSKIGHRFSRRNDDNKSSQSDKIEDLEMVAHKGPLLTVALALFGPLSWLDVTSRYPKIYDFYNYNGTATGNNAFCIDLIPLARLLSLRLATDNLSSTVHFDAYDRGCMSAGRPKDQTDMLITKTVGEFLSNFRLGVDSEDVEFVDSVNRYMSNVFTTAAYLAHEAWISTRGSQGYDWLRVTYDMGTDSTKPSISLVGIIVVSILIGIDLLALLATALYASWYPRWTGSLDAFSLLRIGGTIGERVPLKMSFDDDKVGVLDELPGWVGDCSGDGEIRQIALGGQESLRPKTDYEAYDSRRLRKNIRKDTLPVHERNWWW